MEEIDRPDELDSSRRQVQPDHDEGQWEERLRRVLKAREVPEPDKNPLRSKPKR